MRAFGFELDESPAAAPPWRTPVPPRPPEIDDTIDATDENGEAASPRVRRPWRRRYAMALGLLAVLVAGAMLWTRHGAAPPNYVTAPIGRGDVTRITTASGMVNPVETVQIGSYVSGRIQDLLCDYNSRVTKGQSCAKIDPRSYEAAVEQAAAAISTAQAQRGKDQANLAYVKASYERNLALSNRGVVAQDAIESALNVYRQAQAQVEFDEAAIRQREAELKTARVNLDYTDIISPVDGTVVSRSVAIGQTVAASFQTPTLFLIATDLTRMQVDATVTEAAIGEVHEGQKVTFTVEAFPDRTFTGTVTQVRQAPISVQNVISYDVVVEAANPELLLKPGMTATTHIVVAERPDVVRVPEQALRFAPGGLARQDTDARDKGQVWVLRDGALAQVPVTIGLRDEANVEVTSGDFRSGDRIVTARARPAAQAGPGP